MSVPIYRSPLMEKSKSLFSPYLQHANDTIRVEVAVKQILCGINVRTSASVANAECLDWYRNWNDGHPE